MFEVLITHRSFFEAAMLVCFGISWPISIAKALRTHKVIGKSPIFMIVVMIGYSSGIIYKVLDGIQSPTGIHPIIWLYVFNLVVVFIDLLLYIKYSRNE